VRILILTHPRSGGLSLMRFIGHELNYKTYHEPFNNLSNDEIDMELLVIDNIVVKDFSHHIESKGYNYFDIISKFIFFANSIQLFFLLVVSNFNNDLYGIYLSF
jgi:hypothetical protein